MDQNRKFHKVLVPADDQFDLFDLDVLLIPVHRQCHWLAMAVFPTQRRIALYDSLAHPGHVSSVDVRLIQVSYSGTLRVC